MAGRPAASIADQADDRCSARAAGATTKMLPFIDKHGVGPQDIADIAAYLSRLPVAAHQGQGPGTGRRREALQERLRRLPWRRGQGDATRFYHPQVNGQHFKFTLREMIDIRDGVQRV